MAKLFILSAIIFSILAASVIGSSSKKAAPLKPVTRSALQSHRASPKTIFARALDFAPGFDSFAEEIKILERDVLKPGPENPPAEANKINNSPNSLILVFMNDANMNFTFQYKKLDAGVPLNELNASTIGRVSSVWDFDYFPFFADKKGFGPKGYVDFSTVEPTPRPLGIYFEYVKLGEVKVAVKVGAKGETLRNQASATLPTGVRVHKSGKVTFLMIAVSQLTN